MYTYTFHIGLYELHIMLTSLVWTVNWNVNHTEPVVIIVKKLNYALPHWLNWFPRDEGCYARGLGPYLCGWLTELNAVGNSPSPNRLDRVVRHGWKHGREEIITRTLHVCVKPEQAKHLILNWAKRNKENSEQVMCMLELWRHCRKQVKRSSQGKKSAITNLHRKIKSWTIKLQELLESEE